jgi:hypothetical protein
MGTFIVGYIIVSVLSLIVLAVMVKNAPLGYEDEHGFHYGEPPENNG